jgi:hypothetical protein
MLELPVEILLLVLKNVDIQTCCVLMRVSSFMKWIVVSSDEFRNVRIPPKNDWRIQSPSYIDLGRFMVGNLNADSLMSFSTSGYDFRSVTQT